MRSWIILPMLAACGGTGQNVDAEGCTFIEDGPFTPVTAGTALDDTAPAIDLIDGAFTVTLPPADAGILAFDSPDDTEYALFADRSILIDVYTPAGTKIMPSARATSTSVCATVHQRDIIEMPVGQFFVSLGPDSGGPLTFVLRHFDPD